jgi:hypothetical protein
MSNAWLFSAAHSDAWPRRFAAAVLFVLALAAATSPGALAEGKAPGQIMLTRDHVSRFLAAYPKVRAIGLEHARKDGRELSKVDDPLSTLVRLGSDDGLKAEIDGVVKENGFAGIQEWFKVSQNIALAYAALKRPSDAKVSAEVEKAISKIEKNNFLPANQKKKLISDIRKHAENTGLLSQPKENVDLVRAMKDDIDAVIVASAK